MISISLSRLRVSARNMSQSGRQGIRTLTTNWPLGLANRPGKPYPATFLESTRGRINNRLIFFDIVAMTAGELNPDVLVANQMSCRWTSSPDVQILRPRTEPAPISNQSRWRPIDRQRPHHSRQPRISVTIPDPTVLPPSRMAKCEPFATAIGLPRSTINVTLSPGTAISVPPSS